MNAIITGASLGLGREMARLLASRGAGLVLVARGREDLEAIAEELGRQTEVLALAEDVSQASERIARAAIQRFPRLDALINNASTVGPSPMPELADYPWQDLERVLRVNLLAPLHLTQLVLPALVPGGAIVNLTSDAAVEAYPGWGGYGSSKAALEHLTRTLAAEDQHHRYYLVDPGDMNTRMHREAEPGVDLSQLCDPVQPARFILDLIDREKVHFGRFCAQKAVPA